MAKTGERVLIGTEEELEDANRKIVTVNGVEVGVFRVNGKYYAWRNLCPHGGAPVCEGRVCGTRLPSLVYEYKYGMEQEILRCPWHGWEFDLTTGKHLVGEKTKLKGYTVEEEDGKLFLVV